MAWVPSISDILVLYNLADSVIQGCRNAPDEFMAVQINVSSVMCSVSVIARASKDPRSLINRDQSTRREVRLQSGMCHELLMQIKEVQKKYPNRNMTVGQRMSWMYSDKSKLYDKVGQLDKLVENFSRFLSIESLGIVSPQDIEPEFDTTTSAHVATGNAISKSGRSVSEDDRRQLFEYAQQVSDYERRVKRLNASSPQSMLGLLECWTVDIVTPRYQTDGTIGTPKKQERSQLRLQQMVEEFQKSTYRLPNGDRHERVRHILELRNHQGSGHTTWIYAAGRVVEYESIGADDSATQTVMVILEALRTDDFLRAKSRPLRRPHSSEELHLPEVSRALPVPVARAAPPQERITSMIARPTPQPQGLLTPQPYRIVRVISDPGRRPQQKPSPVSSRGASPAPSDATTVATTSNRVKRIHTDGRCKWGVKCKTPRCPNTHPPPCDLGEKCENLACNYEHPTMFLCPHGSECRKKHCNNDHGRRQCEQDPCTNEKCAMRHCAGQKAVLGWWAIQRMDG